MVGCYYDSWSVYSIAGVTASRRVAGMAMICSAAQNHPDSDEKRGPRLDHRFDNDGVIGGNLPGPAACLVATQHNRSGFKHFAVQTQRARGAPAVVNFEGGIVALPVAQPAGTLDGVAVVTDIHTRRHSDVEPEVAGGFVFYVRRCQ